MKHVLPHVVAGIFVTLLLSSLLSLSRPSSQGSPVGWSMYARVDAIGRTIIKEHVRVRDSAEALAQVDRRELDAMIERFDNDRWIVEENRSGWPFRCLRYWVTEGERRRGPFALRSDTWCWDYQNGVVRLSAMNRSYYPTALDVRVESGVIVSSTRDGRAVIVPCSPMLGGAIANVIIFSVFSGVVSFSVSRIRRACRTVTVRCPDCGYQLLSDGGGCPECGWQRKDAPSKDATYDRDHRHAAG
jgi:hypothetical protein